MRGICYYRVRLDVTIVWEGTLLSCETVHYYCVRSYLYDIAKRSPACIVLQAGKTYNFSESLCSFGKRQGCFKKRQGHFLKTNLCLFIVIKAAEAATFDECQTQQIPFHTLFTGKRPKMSFFTIDRKVA